MVKVHKIGSDIESQLVDPNVIRIIHKQDMAGCCHPAVNWLCLSCCCAGLRNRAYNWVTENTVNTNTPCFCFFDPFRCVCCTTVDCTSVTHLDRAPFTPCCEGCGSPCGARGWATQDDLTYCCWCIECVCLYNCLWKPCFGEMLSLTMCENGTCCFKLGTRCCPCLCFPFAAFMSDSKSYRAAVMQQTSQVRRKPLTAEQLKLVPVTGVAQAHIMAR